MPNDLHRLQVSLLSHRARTSKALPAAFCSCPKFSAHLRPAPEERFIAACSYATTTMTMTKTNSRITSAQPPKKPLRLNAAARVNRLWFAAAVPFLCGAPAWAWAQRLCCHDSATSILRVADTRVAPYVKYTTVWHAVTGASDEVCVGDTDEGRDAHSRAMDSRHCGRRHSLLLTPRVRKLTYSEGHYDPNIHGLAKCDQLLLLPYVSARLTELTVLLTTDLLDRLEAMQRCQQVMRLRRLDVCAVRNRSHSRARAERLVSWLKPQPTTKTRPCSPVPLCPTLFSTPFSAADSALHPLCAAQRGSSGLRCTTYPMAKPCAGVASKPAARTPTSGPRREMPCRPYFSSRSKRCPPALPRPAVPLLAPLAACQCRVSPLTWDAPATHAAGHYRRPASFAAAGGTENTLRAAWTWKLPLRHGNFARLA